MTIHVPIKDFKNRVSEYARRFESGEHVVVTRNGDPVFELAAPKKRGLDLDALRKWRKESGYDKMKVWIAPDFDDPLPEDFLVTPQPPEFWTMGDK